MQPCPCVNIDKINSIQFKIQFDPNLTVCALTSYIPCHQFVTSCILLSPVVLTVLLSVGV